MTFAKKCFHGILGQVAMTCADIDDEWIQPARGAGQRLAKLGINRLANEMFDNGAMWCWCGDSHNDWKTLTKIRVKSTFFLQIIPKSSNILET
jgi:hypothetical protein